MAEQANASTEDRSQFLSRVTSLPLVNSAIDIAGDRYNRIKNYNQLVGSTLNIGERSLNYVAQTAKPVVTTFKGPINFADNLACHGLDKLEGAVPIIKDKPEDFVRRYEDIKQTGIQRVNSLKDYGYEKVNNVLATSYGQTVAYTVDSAISMTENTVDKYLPRTDDEPDDNKSNRNVIYRVSVISDKMRRRMYKQALSKMSNVQMRSKEALNKMKFSVDLIGIARNFDPITAVKNPALWFWEELTKDDPEPDDPSQPKTLDKRVLTYARRATKQVLNTFEEMKQYLNNVPTTARNAFDVCVNYVKQVYTQLMAANSVRDISNLIVDQMSNAITLVQVTLDKTIFPLINRLLRKSEIKNE